MRRAARLGGLLAAGMLLAGCATTGDPQQGGLFGWSEAKARDRQGERQKRVAGEEAELAQEDARGHALETHEARTDRGLAAAKVEHERSEAKLHSQQMALLAKIDQLESESPTPASASRARTYRRKVNTIAAQVALTTSQRSERLRTIEADIDTALERLRR
ncbi:MAG: hypothetical protein ABJF10_23875 [Chthoniobacter sp.]|uniref:hypothetical protein n=1 Tax=Chthoniobacter sp. TaxID=2510640 RepID=UPI0032A7E29A